MGWSCPLDFRDSDSCARLSSSNSSRGWFGSRPMRSMEISTTFSFARETPCAFGSGGRGPPGVSRTEASDFARNVPIDSSTFPPAVRLSSSSFPISGGLRPVGGPPTLQPRLQLLGQSFDSLSRRRFRLVLRDRQPTGDGLDVISRLRDSGLEDIRPV